MESEVVLSAEKDMAYQLDIMFARSKDILVLNDVKIEYDGKTAQIDHLVLTCYSSYFIETKSSWGTISIDEYLDWTRCYEYKTENFDISPLIQSENHGKLLYGLLEVNIDQIMGKMFGLQKHIGSLKPHHYIAIGKKAKINGKGREKLKEQIMVSVNLSTSFNERNSL